MTRLNTGTANQNQSSWAGGESCPLQRQRLLQGLVIAAGFAEHSSEGRLLSLSSFSPITESKSVQPAPHPQPCNPESRAGPPDTHTPIFAPALVLGGRTQRERPLLGPVGPSRLSQAARRTPSLPEDAKNILVASPGRAHSLL